mmetsp:Transcript_10126/g.19117  ORF Transcript_10126/g.19117 Transcript_10126/m.19117 type:complete len:205 (-) Transcript_10126:433-1047(-)
MVGAAGPPKAGPCGGISISSGAGGAAEAAAATSARRWGSAGALRISREGGVGSAIAPAPVPTAPPDARKKDGDRSCGSAVPAGGALVGVDADAAAAGARSEEGAGAGAEAGNCDPVSTDAAVAATTTPAAGGEMLPAAPCPSKTPTFRGTPRCGDRVSGVGGDSGARGAGCDSDTTVAGSLAGGWVGMVMMLRFSWEGVVLNML